MKKAIERTTVLAAVSAVGFVALRRFGPDLAQRGMQKCHEMMDRVSEQGTSERAAQFTEGCGEGRAGGSSGIEDKVGFAPA